MTGMRTASCYLRHTLEVEVVLGKDTKGTEVGSVSLLQNGLAAWVHPRPASTSPTASRARPKLATSPVGAYSVGWLGNDLIVTMMYVCFIHV